MYERSMKRSIATLVLLAFVLAGAVPCSAAAMSCGMKMPAPGAGCGACASTSAATGLVLKAGSCCRSEPGQDRATAPAVLSASGPGSHAPVKVALTTVSAHTAAAPDVVAPLGLAPPGESAPPLSSSRTSVLRL